MKTNKEPRLVGQGEGNDKGNATAITQHIGKSEYYEEIL